MSAGIKKYFEESLEILNQFINSPDAFNKIEKASTIIAEAIKNGNKVISFGNGGSMCDAMHLAEELLGRFRKNRKPYPAIAISDPAYISCVSNDYSYDSVFLRFIEGIGKPGDVLVAISTSGRSKNVIEAISSAKKLGLKVISLTGRDGGNMPPFSDVVINVPSPYNFADHIQEIHIKIIHSIIMRVEEILGDA